MKYEELRDEIRSAVRLAIIGESQKKGINEAVDPVSVGVLAAGGAHGSNCSKTGSSLFFNQSPVTRNVE